MVTQTSVKFGLRRRFTKCRGRVVWLAGAILLITKLFEPTLNPALGIDQGNSAALLNFPVMPVEPQHSIPLKAALETIAHAVTEGYVLFGVEEVFTDGREPTVDLEVGKGVALGAVLRQVLGELPGYGMRVISDHLVDIYPTAAWEDPNDVLNLRLATFDAISKPAYGILAAPRDLIPELNQALRPKPEPGKQLLELYVGGYHGGPPVTLHLRNVTVRDVLNAASVATEPTFDDRRPDAPRGWICAFHPDAPEGYSKYTFSTLFSLPSYWHLEPRKASKP